MIPKKSIYELSSSPSLGHPQQYVCEILPKVDDALRQEILNFARNHVSALENGFIKEGVICRARELLSIAEENCVKTFIMIPKKVQMLSYKTRTADQIHDDNWATMYMEAKVLQNEGKVLYCQPYNPIASDPKDKLFILILQDEWMLEMSIRFSANNAWAIDSTFKTNKYGLSLFAAVLHNQLGVADSGRYGVPGNSKEHRARLFAEMATILRVLDNAHQTLATYDNKIVTEEKEEKVKTCIHELKELLSSLEQEISSKSPKDMEIMLHQLRLSKDMLGALFSPSQIDMPACGSVRQIQAHVTRTRLGHGVPKDVGAPPLEAAPKPIPHTGSLKQKHQRGQNRVQFEKWPRIWCPHCCSKTLLVDPKEVVACQTCHALLPLSLRHCHPGDEMLLLGKKIMAFLESGSWHARIDSCAYAHGTNDERSFKIKSSYENTMQTVFASKLRMVLVY
ncbi:hypothetical protein L7F22_019995 [Adiantum nelumboides]|nr:hypothetical protein [Adiantum nelumboides]